MIQQFKGTHKGEVCLIVGNGPSIDETPLEDLAKKYPTFAANKIYDSAAHPDFRPSFWTCVDELMLTDCIPYIMDHPDFCKNLFVPRHIPLPGAHGFRPVIEIGFSQDVGEKVFMGGTVTYVNMQIARYMGFETALLVGIDHKYPKAAGQGRPGSKMLSDGVDPDHFKSKDSAYFSKNKLYNRPELEGVERHFFPLAKRHFKRVVNLTPGTAEQVFEKGRFEQWA